MKKLHLFYVRSNFHLILALGIIDYKQLKIGEIWFVTSRGVKVPADYTDRFFQLDIGEDYSYREKYYLKHRIDIEKLLANVEVISYSPYDLVPFSKYLYQNCHFFEEGFSAYGNKSVQIGIIDRLRSIFKVLLVWVKFSNASRNSKNFIVGQTCLRLSMKKEKELYVCGHHAYDNIDISGFHKVKVPIVNIGKRKDTITESTIIVMDRLNPKGRPFEVVNYIAALKTILANKSGQHPVVYVKLHPSDNGNAQSLAIVTELLETCNVKAEIIRENLEELAARDCSNTFIGTNSTILFYAPILGKSNQSLSFVRMLAEIDSQYNRFLEHWGGLDKFCQIFSTNVQVL